MVDFLLEEVEGDVLLGPEVVEDRAFRDPRFPRDGLGRRRVEALRLKQGQRRRHDALLNRGFVPDAPPFRLPV